MSESNDSSKSTDPLEQLLELQAHDTKITQLRTRRQGLPERTEAVEVADLDRARAEKLRVVEDERHRIDREQTRIDDEVVGLKERSATADKALYSGTVTNPRELQGIQDEVASLARRVGELEDQELEMMVEREPLDAEAASLTEEGAVLAGRAEDVARRITTAEAEIDAEMDVEVAARAAAEAALDDDLVVEYETLRVQGEGVGVSRLVHGTTCGGCHMKLSAVEVSRIKHLPADTRIHCEDCGRLLVR